MNPDSWSQADRRLYDQTHLALMILMRSRHTIVDELQYITRIAPLIDSIINGELYFQDDHQDVEAMRKKVEELTHGTCEDLRWRRI